MDVIFQKIILYDVNYLFFKVLFGICLNLWGYPGWTLISYSFHRENKT
jgi:hypothetical protein